jgi:hypothetical protein
LKAGINSFQFEVLNESSDEFNKKTITKLNINNLKPIMKLTNFRVRDLIHQKNKPETLQNGSEEHAPE